MQSKISFQWLLFAVSIVGTSFSLVIIFFLTGYTPTEGTLSAPSLSAGIHIPENFIVDTQRKESDQGLPIRLQIPKIKVDVALEQVGLTLEGAVDAPKDPANAAWFDAGPLPGAVGSSIIAGHFGWKNGIPAVFDNLHKLKKGDRLSVSDEKGATSTFVVREIHTYTQGENTTRVFISGDGKAHLNLITCGGVWNKLTKSYSERLVVFTSKEL
jgi:LPXTG-site transpeptidase (sortase) family protein